MNRETFSLKAAYTGDMLGLRKNVNLAYYAPLVYQRGKKMALQKLNTEQEHCYLKMSKKRE